MSTSSTFHPDPDVLEMLQEMSPQFNACDGHGRLDVFRDLLEFQWELMNPFAPSERATAEYKALKQKFWLFSLDYLRTYRTINVQKIAFQFSDPCKPCIMPLGRYGPLLARQILHAPTKDISVVAIIEADRELAREDALNAQKMNPAIAQYMTEAAENSGVYDFSLNSIPADWAVSGA